MAGEFGSAGFREPNFIEDLAAGDWRVRERALTRAALERADQAKLDELVSDNDRTPWERQREHAQPAAATTGSLEELQMMFSEAVSADHASNAVRRTRKYARAAITTIRAKGDIL